MSKILITGSKGVIGTVLNKGLAHDITGFNLPESDILNLQQLAEACRGQEAVVHLAWSKKHDDWLSENFDPDNLQGAFHVFEAACQSGVKRVIMASSVHADDFFGDTITPPLKPYDLPTPDSPYGASKCMIEALGRYYAHAKGLEVICIRFGGINPDDTPPVSPMSERYVWLSHRDAVNLVEACIEAQSVPNNYALVYGVSNNAGLVHDLTNPFGWQPSDGTPDT